MQTLSSRITSEHTAHILLLAYNSQFCKCKVVSVLRIKRFQLCTTCAVYLIAQDLPEEQMFFFSSIAIDRTYLFLKKFGSVNLEISAFFFHPTRQK